MYFERLHIQGFKSFVDRMEIEFRPGITAIVGPNGCGKSNISDAIRWVLGEQNIRTLRGNRLEDLIFNGSPKRKPVGMAEVTLVIHSSGELPRVLPGQTEITRRLFRDGESEYYINRVPCRLKDIVELFMDSGLGKGSYALIEQGKVDLVLRSKPRERRLLVEEAAGIIRYKSKKEEALRKIENTHQNLVRIEDRLFELGNIADTLKKQAGRAKRYLQDKAVLIDLEKKYASFRLSAMKADIKQVTEKCTALLDEITKLETQIATSVRDKNLKEEQLEQLRTELNGLHLRKSTFEKDVDLSLQNIDFSQTRLVELAAEVKNLEYEIEELQEKKHSLHATYTELESELEDLSDQARTAEEQVRLKQALVEEIATRILELTESKESKQRDHLKTISSISQLNQQMARVHSIVEEIDRRQDRLHREEHEYEQKKQLCVPRQTEIEARLSTLEIGLAALVDQHRQLEAEKRSEENKYAELLAEVEKWNEELHRKEARLQSLEERESSLEGYSPGTQALLSEMSTQDRPQPALLTDRIQINRDYELPVVIALQTCLDTVLVEDKAELVSLIKTVQEKEWGRVSLLPLGPGPTDIKPKQPGCSQDQLEGLPRLRQYVNSDPDLSPVLDRVLERMVLASSLEMAIEHQHESNMALTYITTEGVVLEPSGIIRAGREMTATIELYSRKQEIGALEHDLVELKARCEEVRNRKNDYEQALEALKQAGNDCEQQKHTLQLTQQSLLKDLESIQRDISQYENALKVSRLEYEQLDYDLEHNRNEIANLEQSLAKAENYRLELENITTALDEELAELNEQKERVQSELTDVRVNWTSLKEKVDNAQRSLATHQDMLEEFENQARRNERRIVEAHQQKTTLEKTIVDTDSKLKGLHGELETINQDIDQSTHHFQDVKTQVEKETEWEGVLTKTVTPLKETYAEAQVNQRSLEFQLAHVLEDITNRLKCSPQDIESLGFQLADEQEELAFKKKIEQCQKRLEGYDDLNLSAPEEYEAIRTKIDDMSTQKKDVLEAIETLQQTVLKIDRESELRFRTCFDEVNSNFQALFQRLFGGGFAELQLEQEDDLLETGITIVAQPPGKKLQTLSLLSGGEKALTAIAFLVAIFYYRPSPLCFLDEVDAALDEANTSRFTRLLKEMSEKSQIIMITHSKHTVEVADVFYGVTMADPGISRIISLELDKAQSEQLIA